MTQLNKQIDTIAAFRFLNCLKNIGKTKGMIENILSSIDEILLYKTDFEVLVICVNRNQRLFLQKHIEDYYKKHIDFITMHELMYKLSEFPINSDDPYDIPSISKLQQFYFGNEKKYERFFVDAGCYEEICLEQLRRIEKIKDIL